MIMKKEDVIYAIGVTYCFFGLYSTFTNHQALVDLDKYLSKQCQENTICSEVQHTTTQILDFTLGFSSLSQKNAPPFAVTLYFLNALIQSMGVVDFIKKTASAYRDLQAFWQTPVNGTAAAAEGYQPIVPNVD